MKKYKVNANEITKTGKFLKMPRETQALYFHLLQNVEYGVVDGCNVAKLIGVSEDSLKILEFKQYIWEVA